MRHRFATAISAALLSLSFAAAPALAVEPMKSEGTMHKDSMASEGSKGGAMMHKDGMKKDSMAKEPGHKDAMGKDAKDSMGKH